ncbi:hypothetical protein HK102_000429 [Quaeritorhiza haematococci]|nr:hypothetical protein HK102_000429 [Quaeritorhiza haematococci]
MYGIRKGLSHRQSHCGGRPVIAANGATENTSAAISEKAGIPANEFAVLSFWPAAKTRRNTRDIPAGNSTETNSGASHESRTDGNEGTEKLKNSNARGAGVVSEGASGGDGAGERKVIHTTSSKIIGRFQTLKTFKYPQLCQYIEIIKNAKERIFVVSKHHEPSLQSFAESQDGGVVRDLRLLKSWTAQILKALSFLHGRGAVHRNLCSQNVLLDGKTIKLSNWGLYYMTGSGVDVSFPIGHPFYMAPEIVTGDAKVQHTPYPKADVWSVGILLLELWHGPKFLGVDVSNLEGVFRTISSWLEKPEQQVEAINAKERTGQMNGNGKELHVDATTKKEPSCVSLDRLINADDMDQLLQDFLRLALTADPVARPDAEQLLWHTFLKEVLQDRNDPAGAVGEQAGWVPYPYLMSSKIPKETSSKNADSSQPQHVLTQMNLQQCFHLWRLHVGGDLENEIQKQSGGFDAVTSSFLTSFPSMDRVPRLIRVDDDLDLVLANAVPESVHLYSDQVYTISLEGLARRIESELRQGTANADSELLASGRRPRQHQQDLVSPAQPSPPPQQQPQRTIRRATSLTQLITSTADSLFSPSSQSQQAQQQQPTNAFTHPDDWKRVPSWTAESLERDPPPPAGSNPPQGSNPASLTSPIGTSSPFSFLTSAEPSSTVPPQLSLPPSSLSLSMTSPSSSGTKYYYDYKHQHHQLSAREKDPVYQLFRIAKFEELLRAYPVTRDEILQEARRDVPPLLRGKIWAAILGVEGDPEIEYEMFDKDSDAPTDRQLDLDIPRCHQYNDLLSSHVGHTKLKRVLKAWNSSEKGRLVYWQGLDSVCAPFVTLNFNDEALAFASMRAFLARFSENFFVVDNSAAIQEYMVSFRHLLAFHDPDLAMHLQDIGLEPELYAIPWFMTLYSHIFPLDKIYLLWDSVITGPPLFQMYIGLSLLQQLRDQLINRDFNNCMLLFSELSGIDTERCLAGAFAACRATPPSFLSHLITIGGGKDADQFYSMFSHAITAPIGTIAAMGTTFGIDGQNADLSRSRSGSFGTLGGATPSTSAAKGLYGTGPRYPRQMGVQSANSSSSSFEVIGSPSSASGSTGRMDLSSPPMLPMGASQQAQMQLARNGRELFELEDGEGGLDVPMDGTAKEYTGRISLQDLHAIKKFALIVDIRNIFHAGHVAFSISIATPESVQSLLVTLKIMAQRVRFVVVVTDEAVKGGLFANALVNARLPRVCILQTTSAGLETVDPFLCTCEPGGSMGGMAKCNNM